MIDTREFVTRELLYTCIRYLPYYSKIIISITGEKTMLQIHIYF